MEAPGHKRTAVDVRNVLLCDRQSTDRIPLFFRFRDHWRRFDDTLVSPRGRGWESHVRWGKHMFVSTCFLPLFVVLMLYHSLVCDSVGCVHAHCPPE